MSLHWENAWWNVHSILIYGICTQYTGMCTLFLKECKNKHASFCPSEFLPKQLFWHMWSVFWLGGQPPPWAADTADWTMGWNLVTWTLECLLWWDWTVMEDQIWSHFITFFQCVCASFSLLALIFKWKSFDAWLKNKGMNIKEGLNPAVNVWALGCRDNTADSALKATKAFCLSCFHDWRYFSSWPWSRRSCDSCREPDIDLFTPCLVCWERKIQ